MQKTIFLPALALVGGLTGFGLRRWELSAAFDANGLAIPWAPATVALVALSLLMAAAFILLCRNPRNESRQYGDAFAADGRWGYLVLSGVASAMLLLAGVFGMRSELSGGSPGLLRMLLWVLCLVSFVCVIFTVLANFRGEDLRSSMMLLAPAYTFCVWLVTAYQKRAADPVVLDYMYELLAIICTLLAFYFIAGFSFSRGQVWSSALFCLLSVYFGIVTLADGHEIEQRLLVLFSILYQLATVSVLLYNVFAIKPKRLLKTRRMPRGAQIDKKAENTPAE